MIDIQSHKNVVTAYGEYLCTHCGKSWTFGEDVPPCSVEANIRPTVKQAKQVKRVEPVKVRNDFCAYLATAKTGFSILVYSDCREVALRLALIWARNKSDIISTERINDGRVIRFAVGPRVPYVEINPTIINTVARMIGKRIVTPLRLKKES